MYPATFQAIIKPTATTNSIGLVLALPAIIKFQFIKPPKKAAMPVKRPSKKNY